MKTKKNNSNGLLKTVIIGGMIAGASSLSANAENLLNYGDLGSGAELRTNLLEQYGSPVHTANLPDTYKSGEAKCGEGKCGEGKCGEEKKAEGTKEAKKAETKTTEAKCGEGKCGEKKGEKAKTTTKEAKKSETKTTEGKCGEGKCGS
ncbi:hypothetical protein KDU71_17325 [Carboxylicivirga sediminis]|uniref:Low-complexity protein n=1 Tax=Carboxylicivirga sediminis TaxID=2006564 RepID=A0A941F863_9BACT|nr:hypothetical protein [Carboxylicivirga sediminis]MBR8537334.1 hypothetical protein [Carboxylicivirga sediminis]